MQHDERINASELVHLAASQYGLTADQYLNNMRDSKVWGGGPEIVALANGLKYKIILLETGGTVSDNLKVSASFGHALNDNETSPAIYILSANQSFPNAINGNADDNHFLAVFPSSQL